MMTGLVRFNINLLLGAALLACGGCHSLKSSKNKDKKKEMAFIELHLEVTPDGISETKTATVNRREPFKLTVETDPFVDTAYVTDATLLDEGTDMFSIQVKFNWSGSMRLDTYTTANRGKHIAVYSTFGDKHNSRWLAAPVIRQRISDGTFTFTPDASHEEAEAIVKGLKNAAEKMKKDDFK